MPRIRLPRAQSLEKRRGAIAGFVFGIVVMLVAAAVAQVAVTGRGLGDRPAQSDPIYPQP